MKKQPTTIKSRALSRFLQSTGIAGLLPALVLLFSIQPSHAGSATWLTNPTTGDWNTAANWTAGGPPNGPTDTATFASSNTPGVSLSVSTEVNGIVFDAEASAFTITFPPFVPLTISGAGITNNSGTTQTFAVATSGGFGGYIEFTNSATAGSLTVFNNDGEIDFTSTSTAGSATFINNGGMQFVNTSTAGNGAFIQNGVGGMIFQMMSSAGNGVFTINGGLVLFKYNSATSTAGNAIFTINGCDGCAESGTVEFDDASTAGNATIIINGGATIGGSVYFLSNSLGGAARMEVFGNGTGDSTNGLLDISGHGGGVTVGSIEGNGLVILGSNGLTTGANNLSTAFSGFIADGGNSHFGSLAKIGRGKLTLSKANTYTGGTTVSKGTLLVTNRTGSATGGGAVAVNAGTLGGTGKISGAVTIGTATSAAILAPGSGTRPGRLTLSNTLTFNARANYKVDLNSTLATADQVAAKGVTINSGATATVDDLGTAVLTSGTVFTIISNTATTAIAGTFSNLADNSTLTVGSNTYLVSYEGGTGNDLTLTVQ